MERRFDDILSNLSKFSAFKYITFLSQVGISVILPPVLCVFGGSWLKERFLLGDWVVLLCLLLGILVAGRNLYAFMQFMIKQAKKSEDDQL